MPKLTRKRIVLLSLLGFFAAGALFALSPAGASVICKKYKEHKREYKTEENKEIFFKIKWVKEHQPETFYKYKKICEPYRFDHNYFSGNLKKICHDYYIFEEYSDYLRYKRQCHEHDDDNEVTPAPEQEPEPEPGPAET